MTERLADIGARVEGIRQLGAVVSAMRGIAASRAQRARAQIEAVNSYSAILAVAIARALALVPGVARAGSADPRRLAVVLFCAEQGFAGAFSERVLDAARADLATSRVFLVGARGASLAAERGLKPAWNGAMPSQSTGVPRIADEIAEALYTRIATGEIDRLDTVFTMWRPGSTATIERRSLFPLDMARIAQPTDRVAPLLNLAPSSLLSALTADYVHAQLCEAGLEAFAAENEARMAAMASAHTEIERKLDRLRGQAQIVRQEEITAEIIELAAGDAAGQADLHRAAL